MKNDDASIEKKRSGPSRIFAAFRENELVLRRLLKRISASPQDVDDITQETILRALQAENAREINEPKAYLFSIARNVVRDELDKKSRSIIEFIEDFGDKSDFIIEPAAEDRLDVRRRMLLFWDAVGTLPDQCRKVFVLKKVYGYSHQEISRQLGISMSTTEKHVAAGYRRCVEHIEKHESQHRASSSASVVRQTTKKGRES